MTPLCCGGLDGGSLFFFSSFFNLQRAIFVANFSFLRLGLLYSQADLQLAL